MVLIKNLKVAFIHPDLGIGGAERLVLDVAVALADQGVQVVFVTNHFDENHAFEELKSKKFPVRVIGDWIPRSICGKFQALCAYIRMIYLALIYTLFLKHQDKPDIYFVDQIPMAVPFIKLVKGKVIYYCHHPDLLASSHDNKLKRLYRMPIDWLEMYGTSKSDLILVNSQYTASVFRNTFPNIESDIQVLYPTIAVSYQEMISKLTRKDINTLIPEIKTDNENTVFLSINRFHPAKKLELAINAMECLKSKVSKNKWEKIYLVMAGGYDPQSAINAKYFNELVNNVNTKDLSKNVIFLKSPSDALKADLLLACDCLIYTPINEHFGIVPLEAMSASKPVIACNSGGPCETIENNLNGYLCQPRSESIASAMNDIISNRNASLLMGHNGKQRLESKFSYRHFYNQVMDVIIQGIGCSSVIDSCSSSSTGENFLGVEQHREKRKSFDMRANIIILPEIREEMEDEKDDDVDCGLSLTKTWANTESTSEEDYEEGTEIDIESKEESAQDIHEEAPKNEFPIQSVTEENPEDNSMSQSPLITISGPEENKEIVIVDDTDLESQSPIESEKATEVSSEVIEHPATEKPENIDTDITQDIKERSLQEIVADDESLLLLLDDNVKSEKSLENLKDIENFIEAERCHSIEATPKRPLRKFPASASLNEEKGELPLEENKLDEADEEKLNE